MAVHLGDVTAFGSHDPGGKASLMTQAVCKRMPFPDPRWRRRPLCINVQTFGLKHFTAAHRSVFFAREFLGTTLHFFACKPRIDHADYK